MKKFLAAMLLVVGSLFFASAVNAEVIALEGIGEYVMGDDLENSPSVAKERAKQHAVRDACKKAGVYLKIYSRSVNAELTDDEIEAVTATIIKVTKEEYDIEHVPDANAILFRATVQAELDTDDLQKFLDKN